MLSSRFVWEILTHQEMAPRWISTKNINAKDKPAQLCAHLHIVAHAILKLLRGQMRRADWLLFLLAILIVIRFAWVAAA